MGVSDNIIWFLALLLLVPLVAWIIIALRRRRGPVNKEERHPPP